ncbi:diphosphomevalonate/mevalonate 3,5-bisphosphate decarboxylase family protein [Aureivirga sp. CE67]|uniref:diphosphomevalonate/mevalonate 3,5-bisphosphate decarboxylase family protein n=1 Tax=Aureivirga sp. CE67 TaxID=1788983 RepID=UPI0018C913AC|nr:diphosphomevalonate decarboxylase [Aureivirga sp. CE67]
MTEFIPNAIDKVEINEGNVTWRTPSNIALVKYWGKEGVQIPKNPSISFTLHNCATITTLEYQKKETASDAFEFEFYFEGKIKDSFKPKIESFFKRIEEFCPYLKAYKFVIKSENTFPHSSGIASSASGMGALAMCVMHLEKEIYPEISEDYFYKKASFLARLGSGSASRSIKGKLVVWGESDAIPESSNLYGIPFPFEVHDNFKEYCDTILLVDKGQKQVSSTVGHNLMIDHPYAERRFQQANENLAKISEILQNGDLKSFIKLVEEEALALHAMMLTSTPTFILMKPNTLEIINRIWNYRNETDSSICFTLDAGANVHVLYPKSEEASVQAFIQNELAAFCEKEQYIHDFVGNGSEKL